MNTLANLLGRAILVVFFVSVLVAARELASDFDDIVMQPARIASAAGPDETEAPPTA